MLFNSIEFVVFLPIVFILYWFVFSKNFKIQNLLIVVVSYVFYGWWDYRFLSLIFISTLVDYSLGLLIHQNLNESIRKRLLYLSLFVNLGFLGFFKYYNFFVESIQDSFNLFGVHFNTWTLKIILPVGISFYTFQTLSYTIDIYRRKLVPTNDFIAFSAFVSFFPQLVAGPIERATNLLPQFHKKRSFNYAIATNGLQQILWGVFKKVVIADSCAVYVNQIFEDYNSLNVLSLLLGAVYFSFQIYGDFSGYSDIAIGTARLFGFNLKINFNFPYFSRNIAEFWRRWHISLSTWFRDYLYIPLGGSRGGKWQRIRNIFVIFLISGFWHGANWTFIFWGLFHACYFLPLLIKNKNRKFTVGVVAEHTLFPNFKELIQVISTFTMTSFAWIFFRAENLEHALLYIYRLFNLKNGFGLEYLRIERYNIELLILLLVFIILEWHSRRNEHPFFGKLKFLKMGIVLFLVIIMGVFSVVNNFIYFQF